MTVTYSVDVSSASFCGLHRLLFRWKGSIWKSIVPELALWLLFYFLISFCYRFGMNNSQQRIFEQLSTFFYTYSDYIPVTFLLGFYVSAVFTRWSQYLDNIGWIDSPSLLIATYIRGTDEMARRIRRNILRYLVLTQAMVFRDISSSVKKRFPTMNHLVTAGIMTENELKEFDSIQSPHIKYWVPMQWIFNLLRKAREDKMIESDIIYTDMLEKIRQYRVNVLSLTIYDWVPIPLVYTQVVNIAVRAFFVIALFGRQYLIHPNETNGRTIDLYVPIMSILQFLFYIGWVKVAEVLLNPLGEDDDDFETNWVIDRNLQVGLSIVDDGYGRLPEIERDVFWFDVFPQPLYTPASALRQHNPMIGSCNDLMTAAEDALLLKPRPRLMSSATMLSPQKREDVDLDEYGHPITPVVNHNPKMRRCSSVDQHSNTRNSLDPRNHVSNSISRHFSKNGKSSIPRRSSTTSTNCSDWYNDKNSITPKFSASAINNLNSGVSRTPSVCSSVLYDGIQSPFVQSYGSANFNQSRTNPISDSSHGPLNPAMLPNSGEGRKSADSETMSPTDKSGQSWTMSELPVIYEERTHSSTDSGSTVSDSNETLAKKEDLQDFKTIMNKNLSIIDEENHLPFAKTVSFASSIGRQKSDSSNSFAESSADSQNRSESLPAEEEKNQDKNDKEAEKKSKS